MGFWLTGEMSLFSSVYSSERLKSPFVVEAMLELIKLAFKKRPIYVANPNSSNNFL